jgi:ribosomal protein S18 acetylase RimI-like enzyme
MGPVVVETLRAERAEAAHWATYARNIPTSDDTRDTGAVPVAGGYAICLQGSAIEYGLGVGIARPLREDDLRIVDEFYGSRKLASRLELHPDVAQRDAALLERWGYRFERSMTMFEREIDTDPAIARGLSSETLTGRKAEWTDMVVAAHSESAAPADFERIRRTTQVCASAASALIGIRVDGRLAAGGALGVTGDAAFLFCAGVLPEFRRRGAYAALVSARLAMGRSRGATFAFLTAPPGSAVERGALAAGFTATYVRGRLRKR